MIIKQIAIDEALELHKRGLMVRWFGIIANTGADAAVRNEK